MFQKKNSLSWVYFLISLTFFFGRRVEQEKVGNTVFQTYLLSKTKTH